MKKQTIITMMAAWMMMASAMAQTVTAGFEMGELIRIGSAYRQAPYLSFDIKYQYADSTAPFTILEEINGKFKMHDGRFWAMLDSTEMVQGNNYDVTVFHQEKLITINKPQYSDSKVFQLPVMDTLFSRLIDSMHVSQLCDTMNLIKIYFNSQAPCQHYQVRYNPTTYLINSMQYYMKNQDSANTTSLIKTSICNYSKSVVSEGYFMESKFIYRDGTFYKRPDYSDYELIVNGDF